MKKKGVGFLLMLVIGLVILAGCPANGNVKAQHVLPGGVAAWSPNGVYLTNLPGWESDPSIIADGLGGAIVAWSSSNEFRTAGWYVQRLGSGGIPAWQANGILVGDVSSQGDTLVNMAADGAGGVFIRDARILANGTLVGHNCPPGSGPIISDGSGDATCVGGLTGGLTATRVHADGSIVWSTNLASGTYKDVEAVSDGAGGAFIAWCDVRWIYAQHVLADGSAAWTPGGVTVSSTTDFFQSYDKLHVCSDGMGGDIVLWEQVRSGNAEGTVAQRILADGTLAWAANGLPVFPASGTLGRQPLVADGAHGAILVWRDDRSGEPDIYAQRVLADGTLAWTPGGLVVCNVAGNRWGVVTTTDGMGGAIISWWDERGGSYDDVYCQRLLPDGNAAWGQNGVLLCNNTGERAGGLPIYQAIASDGAGGAFIALDVLR